MSKPVPAMPAAVELDRYRMWRDAARPQTSLEDTAQQHPKSRGGGRVPRPPALPSEGSLGDATVAVPWPDAMLGINTLPQTPRPFALTPRSPRSGAATAPRPLTTHSPRPTLPASPGGDVGSQRSLCSGGRSPRGRNSPGLLGTMGASRTAAGDGAGGAGGSARGGTGGGARGSCAGGEVTASSLRSGQGLGALGAASPHLRAVAREVAAAEALEAWQAMPSHEPPCHTRATQLLT